MLCTLRQVVAQIGVYRAGVVLQVASPADIASRHRQPTGSVAASARNKIIKMLNQKTTQHAISAMSRLAELHADNQLASSADIAKARNLAQPLVAKVLTTLARAGLITGSPGPGGGYRFANEPRNTSLHDVAMLFERENETACPFGPGWCGDGDPCPLHHSLLAMKQIETDYLKNTTFDVFCAHPQEKRRSRQKKE